MLLEPTVKKKQLISMTPLIDVVFILLLFFMLSSTFIQTKQLPITTASSKSNTNTPLLPRKLLVIDEAQVELNGISYTISSSALETELLAIAESDQAINIAAVDTAPLQSLVHVIDLANTSGISRLKLSPSIRR